MRMQCGSSLCVFRLVLADEHHDLMIWTLEPHPEGTQVEIEYTGMWSGDLGIMRMENMAFGTGLFLHICRGCSREARISAPRSG